MGAGVRDPDQARALQGRGRCRNPGGSALPRTGFGENRRFRCCEAEILPSGAFGRKDQSLCAGTKGAKYSPDLEHLPDTGVLTLTCGHGLCHPVAWTGPRRG